MHGTDEDLGRGLREAAGRRLPDEDDFVRRVRDALDDGGGTRAIDAGPLPAPRRRILGLAAAAALVGLGLWAAASGHLLRAPTAPGEEDDDLAAAGIELPTAETAVPMPRPIRITVDRDGTIRAGRAERSLDQLRRWLIRETGGEFATTEPGQDPDLANEATAILRIDRRTRWQSVQWVMQVLADHRVRIWRIYWAVETDSGRAVLPAFLPVHPGITAIRTVRERPILRVEAVWLPDEETTQLQVLDGKIGTSFRRLRERLDVLLRTDPELPVEIYGDAGTPFGSIARIVDVARAAGAPEITFIGAPPPVEKK